MRRAKCDASRSDLFGRRLPVRVRFDQIGFAQGLGFLVYYVLCPNVELVFP